MIIGKHLKAMWRILWGCRMTVGGGDTYEEVLVDVKSANKLHIEIFEKDAFETGEI